MENYLDSKERKLNRRVYYVVMLSGFFIVLLFTIAVRMPVYAVIMVMFPFTGIWTFVAEKVTEKVINGYGK
jgi:hypothetical protein